MIRLLFSALFVLFVFASSAQTTGSVVSDSTYKIFPNPAHQQFYATTQGKVMYATLITTNGEKRHEFSTWEIPSYPNQNGYGCVLAGCAGAFIASNYICTIQRGNFENGLYYLVMIDEYGQVYHTIIVFN